MARISAEDCLVHIPSPFALVHSAVRRARQLQMGSKPLAEKTGDKPTVTALREIAKGLVEQIPLSDQEHEEPQVEIISEEEEFAQIIESPDLNVQLDAQPEDLDTKQTKKRASKDDFDEDDEFDEEDYLDEEE